MERKIDTEAIAKIEAKEKKKRKKPFGWWNKERVDRRPLGGPQISSQQWRRITGKRIARVLRIYALQTDKRKAADMPFLDLVPYAEKVVDQFAADFKLKAPKKLLSTPGGKKE